MKKKIKINFTDFYNGFIKTDNHIYHVLNAKYTIIIDETNPDYLFYSCFGYDFLHFDCIKIFYTGENIIPDFNFCDYATGFAYINFEDRYRRYPNYVAYGAQVDTLQNRKKYVLSDVKMKSRFCNFIYSNSSADPVRDQFYHLLSKYKPVDSAGKHLNNIKLSETPEGWAKNKVDFMADYKFSIAFENSSFPGYTTEKIIHAFFSRTIPIYWGDPLINLDFNSKAFINCHEYKNMQEVIEKVIEIDQDDDLYLDMINQPIFVGNNPAYLQKNYLLDFYSQIIEQPIESAFKRTKYGFVKYYDARLKNRLMELEAHRKVNMGIRGFFKSLLKKYN